MTQPLIAPLYEGQSPHDFIARLYVAARPPRPVARQGFLDQDLQQRRRRLEVHEPPWGRLPQPGRVLARGLHDGFMAGTSFADGRTGHGADRTALRPRRRHPHPQVLPQRPGSAAAPPSRSGAGARRAGSPRSCPCRGSGAVTGRPRDHLPARSDHLGRPLRQQRLAAGAAQALHEGHLGPDRVDQHAARRRARPSRRVTSSSCAIAATPCGCRCSWCPAIRRSRSRCSSATAAATRAGSEMPSDRRAVQRVPAADVRCAVVRQRARAREDRRALSAGDHPGASLDGGPRTGPHRDLEEYKAKPDVIHDQGATRRRAP